MRKLILPFLLFFSFLNCNAQNKNSDFLHQKAITLRRFLELHHYQPLIWNDTTSALLYNRWMKLLDENKLFFIQSDIEQLTFYKSKLGEELRGNGWAFFDKSSSILNNRSKHVDSCLLKLLSKPLDFSKNDFINWPLTDYANSISELYKRWERYIKWQLLHNIAEEIDTLHSTTAFLKTPANFLVLESTAREKLKKQILHSFQEKKSVAEQFQIDLADMYLGAISWCYDPHTAYMNNEGKNNFENTVNSLEFSAGIQINKNEKGEWAISYLIPGGSAWSNGELHKGDIILKIKLGNDQDKELLSMEDEEVKGLLTSNESEQISLTIVTAGGIKKTVSLKMQKITVDEGIVKSYILRGENKIGYIILPGFYSKETQQEDGNGCANDVAKEIIKLKKDTIKGLILDLRSNGGGSMWEALQLAGIFIDEGPISSIKDKTGKVHFLRDPNRGTIYDGPLIVMVNGASASASELVSAALQDYHRALIVGSTTYGKGSAQQVLPMDTTNDYNDTESASDFVKVTTEKFYRINGSTTQWTGVIPDIILPQVDEYSDYKEKGTASALTPDFTKKALYVPLQPLPISVLKSLSTARVEANANFKIIEEFSAWYKKNKTQVIPLQWPAYSIIYSEAHTKYKELEEEASSGISLLSATNNSFDREQLARLTNEENNAVNEAYLKKIGKDDYIAEAYAIMADWLQLKNK